MAHWQREFLRYWRN